MLIELHPAFKKSFKKRIANNSKLKKQFQKRIDMFRQNPQHPLLKNHSLIGEKKGYWSFSVTGDIRVIYKKNSPNKVVLLDVGSHNQVY